MPPKLKSKASETSKESTALDESAKESGQENFSRAAEVIVQLVTKFDSDPDYEIEQSDLDVLFQSDTLAPFWMISLRWGFLLDALWAITNIEEETFPLDDFIDFILETDGLHPKTINFFLDFKLRISRTV